MLQSLPVDVTIGEDELLVFACADTLSKEAFSLSPKGVQSYDRTAVAKSLDVLPGSLPSQFAEDIALLVNVSDVLVEAIVASWKHIQHYIALPSTALQSPHIQNALSLATHSFALLRIITGNEVERRRLTHTALIEYISKMLTSYVENPVLRKSVMKDNNGECAQLLVQSLAVLRNISLDKSARQLLLTSFPVTTRSLCALLTVYSSHAEVILMVARVLAKLSLYEGFRVEMSASDGKSLGHMVKLVQGEGRRCKEVMEGVETNEEWPSWHTWPLLSRICFTLGNLTNSNERNRAVIGMTLDCTQSILILLQVCSSTLCTLTVRKQQQQMKEKEKEVVSVFGFASRVAR